MIVKTRGSSISFRDPDGILFQFEDQLLRLVQSEKAPFVATFLSAPETEAVIREGGLVQTRILDPTEVHQLGLLDHEINSSGEIFLEHKRVTFSSYPFEWPTEMLHSAALLTLELATRFLSHGISLKDATPYNILYNGPKSIFVDLLSFEQRDTHDPIWRPYSQFMRTFILPLLAAKEFGIPSHRLLLGGRNGIAPEELYPLIDPVRKLFPIFFKTVTMPVWLSRMGRAGDSATYSAKRFGNREKARFVLQMTFRNLKKTVEKLRPPSGKGSTWTGYEKCNSYCAGDTAAKESFLIVALQTSGAKRLLDIGCNTGHYSEVAARSGTAVVAIDTDSVVVGEVWRRACKSNLDILPLVIDFANPSPATGWECGETRSFLERAAGSFDAVLVLAVLHHLIVTEQIPLKKIMNVLADITTDLLIIEFVPANDPMFVGLARGREVLYREWSSSYFESVCRSYFDISSKSVLSGNGRILYSMRKRTRHGN